MGRWHRHGWGGRPGGPPPWWPENEPFPLRGPDAWRGVRGRFIRRMWFGVLFFFGLVFLASALAVSLLSGAFHLRRGLVVPGALLGLVILGLAIGAVVRTVRRMAGPVADVMAAADRVAAGDYGVRVPERGTREVRRLARAFNAMTEHLGANDEQRRSLLADLAHELRTPLSVIRGSVEGVLDGLYPADRAHLGPVLDETTVMARLLDDLRTLSTAEAGALRLDRERVGPTELVEDAVASFRSRADAAGVTLRTEVASGLPAVDADPMRVGEVLGNLLQNAVRHTPRGGSVHVKGAPADDDRAVEFIVDDTGSGIPPEMMSSVFDRFVKAADTGGAGLGLAIAKGLLEAHGGRIAAERRPGGGTRVRFTLPASG
jgi:signal transduction histidine kinase